MHCLFRERASEHRSVMVSVLLPLLSCLFLSVNSQGLLGVYLVYSDSGSYNSTSALNGAMDAVQEFAGHLPGHSINFTTLDDKVSFRSKYFYYYSLFIVQCVQRTTRILPVCVQASSLRLYNRWWLSIQYICTAGDCRIPRDTSCESVFKCVWPCLLPRVVYQQSHIHTHNMIFTNA